MRAFSDADVCAGTLRTKGDAAMCAGTLRTEGQESTFDRSDGTSDQQEGIMTRKFFLLAATFVLVTGLFGVRMLTSPPVSEAARNTGVDVTQIEFNAPKNLPSFADKYQRGTGVLDVFMGPMTIEEAFSR
jgi:hypothetical protein